MHEFEVFNVDISPQISIVKTLHCEAITESRKPDFQQGYHWYTYKLIISIDTANRGSCQTEIEFNDYDFLFNEPFASIFDLMSKKY